MMTIELYCQNDLIAGCFLIHDQRFYVIEKEILHGQA
jgi:hypothetical protein